MTIDEAAKTLEVPIDAAPEELEARFNELRRRLEDKIAKAPTPGLQAKYRATLAQVTAAFEALTLAADSSTLPVLQRKEIVTTPRGAAPDAAVTSPSLPPRVVRSAEGGAARPSGRAAKKGAGKEFLVVVILAITVLGAGGWWILTIRAEKAEQARLAELARQEAESQAAAAKAEVERLAEVARQEAEAKRKAEEEQRVRLAAEAQRLDQLTGQLRAELAAYKVEWEALEKEERTAERRLSELRSDLRSLRDAPPGRIAEAEALVAGQQDYFEWLSETLVRHPARVARGRAEELLAARQPDAAQAAVADFKAALATLVDELPQQRAARLAIAGELAIRTDPGVRWELTDAFGRVRSGQGAAQVDAVAFGPARLRLTKPHWPVREVAPMVVRGQANEVAADFTGYGVTIVSDPAAATVETADGRNLGITPLDLSGLPPGELALTLRKERFYDERLSLKLPLAEAQARTEITLRPMPKGLVKPARWIIPPRVTMESRMTMVMDHGGSTGLYANTAGSNRTFLDVEEWDFSQPNEQGDWQQVVRRVVRQNRDADLAAYTIAGAVIRYQLQPSGVWHGSYVKGAPADATLANAYLSGFAAWFVRFGLADAWPEQEVSLGGTWPVNPANLPGMNAVQDVTGTATGKLLGIERSSDREWAEIEYTFDIESGPAVARSRQTGTYRLQVNLKEMFLSSYEYRATFSSRTVATPKDVMLTTATTTQTMVFSQR